MRPCITRSSRSSRSWCSKIRRMVSPGLVDTMAVRTPALFSASSSSAAPGNRVVPSIISVRPAPWALTPTVSWKVRKKVSCRSGSWLPVISEYPSASVSPMVGRTWSTVGGSSPRAANPRR